ncbi:MAG: MT-A70 family methyltransferase, partial [Thermoplasmata archaeon]|nr:MT-A70 family methyltransferase [Thermoplasmata archaeon]
MIPFPDKKYKIIYADPPWEYDNKKTGGHSRSMRGWAGERATGQSAACQKYNTMSLTELCDLPIEKIKDKSSCVLFLWVTVPLKYDIATSGLLETWGFEYKTTFYWRKIMSLGMGYWFRGQIEECWLCIDGDVKAFGLQIPNFIQRQVGEHSEKPKE